MPKNPNVILTEFIGTANSSCDSWPQNIKLYQPFQDDQILLPDSANCLATQAYLKMCKLNYDIISKRNCEAMSPSGKVPFIRCDKTVISEFKPIVKFMTSKGTSLCRHLSNTELTHMSAYISLITIVLQNAENYLIWLDYDNYINVTKPRCKSMQPWPLDIILTQRKRKETLDHLSLFNWIEKTQEDFENEVHMCFQALSDKIEGKYFFGALPTELDALVFGHVFTILTTLLPNNHLAEIIQSYPKLINHCKEVENELFTDMPID